jgi:hypothetical protein
MQSSGNEATNRFDQTEYSVGEMKAFQEAGPPKLEEIH